MSIADELREWAARELAGWKMARERFDELTAIAGRIDAEYQKAIRELNNLADTSVLLPVDADGVPVRLNDLMEWPDHTRDPFEVIAIGNGTLHYVEDGEIQWTSAETKRHYTPDTWERIIRDAIGEGMARELSNYNGGYDRSDSLSNASLVARCKALAGDAE